MEAFLFIFFGLFSLTILIFLSNLYLSTLNEIQEKKQIEYWNQVNENINEFNRIEFIGGPCDGDWKLLPKDKSIYLYKNHQYTIEEINDGNKTKKVYKYSKK